MKKKLLSLLTALALAAGLAPAAPAAAAPFSSSNQYFGDYTSDPLCTPSSPITSYLYTEGDKLIRVECINGWRIVVETYDSAFQLRDSRTISMEDGFDAWGGFFAGAKYNFILLGQWNAGHDDRVATYCVVKYSKSWQRLGQATLSGVDTAAPFQGGIPRFLESGNSLYIHAGREMYSGHQASSLYRLDQEAMTLEDLSHLHYISHSLNQFPAMDERGNLVLLDQGDAAPRSANLHRFDPDMDYRYPERYPDSAMVSIRTFSGAAGDNNTGATLGGLVRTSSGFLTALSDTNLGDRAVSGSSTHNVYLLYTPGDNFSAQGTVTKQVTGYPAGGAQSAGTPFLVPTGSSSGYLLWKVKEKSGGVYRDSNTIAYATYHTATGNLSAVQTAAGALSDCQPIPYQGGLVWYVTANGAPTFYTLNASGITAHKAGGGTATQPETPTVQGKNPVTLTAFCGSSITFSDLRSDETARTFRAEYMDMTQPVFHLAPTATLQLSLIPGDSCIVVGYWVQGNTCGVAGFPEFDESKTTFTRSDLEDALGAGLGGQKGLYNIATLRGGDWWVMFDGDATAPVSTPYADSLLQNNASGPSQSLPPAQPAPQGGTSTPAAGTAYPSTQSVLVDGRAVEFQMYALKNAEGNLTNYVKLRDLASVLTDTDARFEVSWDGAVNIVTGRRYTANGSEMHTPFSGERPYTPATAPTNVNGSSADLEAIVLMDDRGGAYTYYKLRDLGAELGFLVDWDSQRGVYIETR